MAGVRIGKDKLDFVKLLTAEKGEAHGPFETMADVLVFAASLGVKKDRRAKLGPAAPDPIRLETFDRREYIDVINLIALTGKGDARVLSKAEEDERLAIFEEFANGGLEVLREYLSEGTNITQRLLLLLNEERNAKEEDLDLSDLVGMADLIIE